MKILITGAKGFIGKNLTVELKNRGYGDILEYDLDSTLNDLDRYCKEADFVYHLAGVNRPTEESEFMKGHYDFTAIILDHLKKHQNFCPVMISSSIQASLDNPYGRSKKAQEALLFTYHQETGAKVLVYRFPNVFGKWCRPNYNSVVATFCHHIASDLSIEIHNPDVVLNLVYIDDVVHELIRALEGKENRTGLYCEVPVVHTIALGALAELIYSFKKSRENGSIPNMLDPLTKKLYSTYLSYLPEDRFSYPLKMNEDHRGSFTEFIKTQDRGQVSINITKPGVTKGNHWHHTKTEKFLVVSGKAVIRFRKIDSNEVLSYFVSGEKLEVVDIPIGYTHQIENVGDTDLVTIMWANELYDEANPDTYFLEV